MSLEEPIEVLLVGVAEIAGPAQKREAGPEQVRFVCWGPPLGVAALYLSAYQGETFGEPARHVKAVEHVARVGQIVGDGCLIRAGPVGNDYLHLPAPVRSLIPKEPAQRPFRTTRDHRQHLAGVVLLLALIHSYWGVPRLLGGRCDDVVAPRYRGAGLTQPDSGV